MAAAIGCENPSIVLDAGVHGAIERPVVCSGC
jgi:hypothetical protein